MLKTNSDIECYINKLRLLENGLDNYSGGVLNQIENCKKITSLIKEVELFLVSIAELEDAVHKNKI